MRQSTSGTGDVVGKSIEAEFHQSVLPMEATASSGAELAGARVALLDALAVACGTLDHEVARASRQVFPADAGTCTLWGTPRRSSPRQAVVANGAALRCYDFNDLYVGASGQGGHPSDALAGLVAVAEMVGASGAALLDAVVMAYRDIVRLMDLANVTDGGWDYANLVGLGSVRALCHLMGMGSAETARAATVYGACSLATNELESGDRSEDGNLTSWKRCNGSRAVMNAMDACSYARAGIEGPVRSLMGEHGFFAQQGVDVAELVDRACRQPCQSGVLVNVYKQWPVGSRAQSAIQAMLALRDRCGGVADVVRIRVEAYEDVVRHLVRSEAYEAKTRETADHSLPYIVAVALADGRVGFEHFDDPEVRDRGDVHQLLQRTDVVVRPGEVPSVAAGYPVRVTVEMTDGRSLSQEWALPMNVVSGPSMAQAIDEKWDEYGVRRLGVEQAATVRRLINELDRVADVRELTSHLIAMPAERG